MNVQSMNAEPSGVLLINKHKGVTSHDIVNKVRRLYGTRRVGHTGTLDPMATGVLVVLVGRAAKAAEYLVADQKRYRAVMRLGITTDSEDITGNVLCETKDFPNAETVLKACQDFVGNISQIPPMYSALKVKGQKLVDLARKGITVERQAREVTIFSLVCTPTERDSDYILDVECSSGTYIRTLCADIGAVLGCCAVMSELERTETGGFTIENSYTLEKLQDKDISFLHSLLIPTEALFDSLPRVNLPSFYERLFRSGCEIYQKKIGTSLAENTRVRVCRENGSFFALGEVREYEEGRAIKSIKLFELE
ncbi:MAG: tRNA pseudouridine(55) synthase TruB [Clostridia bacterium]|nr:tRNA pseudouridine(55) synthase TruB [Clostridia bacterium]